MKSLVFKSAWKMVKETGINFRHALKLSWANEMANKLALEISIAEGIAFNYKKVKSLNLKLNSFLKTLNTMSLGTVSYGPKKAYDNSGARFDYGVGIYNGD